MEQDIIAVVGAGSGGLAILQLLADIPGIQIKWVYDSNQNAPGLLYAKKKGYPVSTDTQFAELVKDDAINLVFEITGQQGVFDLLAAMLPKKTTLIGAHGTKIIFHLLDAQIAVTKKLEELKRTLEQRIIRRTKEIETANKNLQVKIQEYEKLNEKLQQINNEKTKYLLQATHQLKAPFAAIQSYADIIIEGYTGDVTKETMDVMLKIQARCTLLQNSIKQMLELANLKSFVHDNMKFEVRNVNDLVEASIEKASILAEKKDIQIQFEAALSENLVRCSPPQLAILFDTLLENAINYSNDKTFIQVRISNLQNLISIAVADQGIGINPLSLDKIFNEYYRTNEAVAKHENGTGLGLAIAREIANIHRGSVNVESRLGEGSTFTVVLQGATLS